MSKLRLISSLITKKYYVSSHSNSIVLSLRQSTRKFNNSSTLRAQDSYLVKTPKGENYRLHLAKSRHLVGIRTTRGMREYNEDRYQATVLEFSSNKARQVDELANQPILDGERLENGEIEGKEGQICYFAVFDGHGGPQCADYLTANLHKNIEEVKASDADDIITILRSFGGYFKRFKPTSLETLLSPEVADITPKRRPSNQKPSREPSRNFSSSTPSSVTMMQRPSPLSVLQTTLLPTPLSSVTPEIQSSKSLTMEQKLTLAFLKTDIEVMNILENKSIGSTASTALIKSLDKHPFWISDNIEITISHVGDSKILLCEVENGNSIHLTFDHHPSSIMENDRLRKFGGHVIIDSFGSEMFLGKLAISRSFGDGKMKKFGISAEPDVTIHNLIGKNFAFMVLVSDGITSVLSDQEIVDCIKICSDPTLGASKLVDLADELGSEDNMTAMVVRLPGWGSPMSDQTKDLRNYRLEHNSPIKRRR